jgi:guanylate kinase
MSGLIFIVAAPSGAGKSSLVNALLAVDPNVKLSVSYTTRAPRPGEQDGREYHFTDQVTFKAMAAKGDFLESAEVHGNFYGTSQTWLDRTRSDGQDIVLEIDWQGAQQVRRLYSSAAVGIFILPPSMAELERRLRTRGQDSEAVIRKRLANAAEELGHVAEFDYAIINNDFAEAGRDLAAIVRAARLRTANQIARSPAAFRIA